MSQQINLYNPLLLKQKKLFSFKTMSQALGLILLGSLLFYFYALYRTADLEKQAAEASRLQKDAIAKLDKIKAEYGPRKPSKLLEEEVARMEAQVGARRHVVDLMESGTFGNRKGFSGYFRALSRQTVDGLWLTGFRVSGTGEISISGRTLKPDHVPVLMGQLKREIIMEGSTFSTLEISLPPAASADGKQPAPAYLEFSLHNAEKGAAR